MNNQRQGFSLIELSIAMAITAILASAIVPIAIRSFQIKAGVKTALEMAMIEEASRNYYFDNLSWPADVTTLQSKGYLNPQWNARNPWKNAYLISNTSLQLTVTTDVPAQWTNMVASHLSSAVINNTTVSSTISSMEEAVIAPGVIAAWSGSIANIPKGWLLCDGTRGTPDLRNRFIVGASQDVSGVAESNIMGSFVQVGGKATHDHGAVTGAHVLTIAEIPPHTHNMDANDNSNSGGGIRPFLSVGSDHINITTASTGGGQGHTHSISSDYNVPPFFALAYIMKI